MELFVAASILLSAGTYLFDFASNIAIAVDYGEHYFRFNRLKEQNLCNDICRNQASELTGYFWGILGVLFISHTLNALIFKFKFHKKDDPFKAAYFLPLIHLWRLLCLVRNTFNYRGIRELRSAADINGLFNILGASFEGMPLLILQFCAYIVLVKGHVLLNHLAVVFKISVVASLLSAAYNGGSSVESIMTNARSFRQKLQTAVSSGAFTMFASISRCLTYVNVIIHMRDYFQQHRSTRSKAKYHPSDAMPILFLVTNISSYWIFYWLLQYPELFHQRLRQWKKCVTCLVFGYMSIITGPLYPMVSEARDCNELGSSRFRTRLIVVGGVNICIDLAVVIVTYWMGTLAKVYLVVSLISALGYFLCLGWFTRIDSQCRPSPLTEEIKDDQDSMHETVKVDEGKCHNFDLTSTVIRGAFESEKEESFESATSTFSVIIPEK